MDGKSNRRRRGEKAAADGKTYLKNGKIILQ